MPTFYSYDDINARMEAAQKRREKEARKRAESWARMVRSFAAARSVR